MANESKTLDLYQSLSAIIKDDDDLYEKVCSSNHCTSRFWYHTYTPLQILCFEMLELRELHQYFRDRGVKCSLQDLRYCCPHDPIKPKEFAVFNSMYLTEITWSTSALHSLLNGERTARKNSSPPQRHASQPYEGIMKPKKMGHARSLISCPRPPLPIPQCLSE